MTNTEAVYHISTFRPEKCGIAYWTEDKINYLQKVDPGLRNKVIAINGFRKISEYADAVEKVINRDVRSDYPKIAEHINNDPEARMAWIEHEFGIFGGESLLPDGSEKIRDGHYILDFLENIDKPVGLTTHTVLKDNDPKTKIRKNTLINILNRVDRIVAISDTAKNILVNDYKINPEKIERIYHGAHEFPESTEQSKKILGLQDKFVLSTPGLLRENRGIEYAIQALPEVIDKHPDVIYIIAGATHPREMQGSREPYRESLEKIAKENNIEKNVLFVSRSLSSESLLRYIQASDIGIIPYKKPGQISSGVLTYFIGLNKPVISTPFPYAQEILSEGRGVILRDYRNPESIKNALLNILDNRDCIQEMKININEFRDKLMWPNIARTYHRIEKELIG